jgi:hypothetical protein
VLRNKYDFKKKSIVIHADWSKHYLSLVVPSIKSLLATDRDTEFVSRFANWKSLRIAITVLHMMDMGFRCAYAYNFSQNISKDEMKV